MHIWNIDTPESGSFEKVQSWRVFAKYRCFEESCGSAGENNLNFWEYEIISKQSTIIFLSMTKNMRFLNPAYLFWAIVETNEIHCFQEKK